MGITEIWTMFFLQPMINSLLWLYSILWNNFALSITVFTIIVRLITMPLTIPQMNAAKKMKDLQPKLKELQKKFTGDKEGMSRAQMALYKEYGVNPLGGCLPTLVQFPIWIGLYQAISQVLAVNPLQVLQLSKNIYLRFPGLSQLIPLDDRFMWLNLGRPDPYYILPVLVAASMFFQQKLMTTPGADPSSASMTKSMTYTMPLMFGFFSLQFSSGLSIYFIMSAVVGIAIQYALNKRMGLGSDSPPAKVEPSKGGFSILSLLGLGGETPPPQAVAAKPTTPALPAATVENNGATPQGQEAGSSQAPASTNTTEKGNRRRARKKKR